MNLNVTLRIAGAAVVLLQAWGAGEASGQAPTGKSPQAGADKATVTPCRLDSSPAPPLRYGGRAQVKLSGAINLEAKDAPASCGAYWVREVDMGFVKHKAGDGVVFETCTTAGLLQVSNDEERRTGKINLAAGGRPVLITFNRAGGGGSLAWNGFRDKSGTLEIAADARSAAGAFTVRDMAGNNAVSIDVKFDCR